MPRETNMAKRERALQIESRMLDYYGEGACSLDYTDPFRLTIAVILSAQCTDAAVNKVTPTLFSRYPTPTDLAQANISDVEGIIHSLGFFRNKAKNIVKMAQAVVSDFGGVIPNDLDLLQTLPGGAQDRKRGHGRGIPGNAQGIAVDTHCSASRTDCDWPGRLPTRPPKPRTNC